MVEIGVWMVCTKRWRQILKLGVGNRKETLRGLFWRHSALTRRSSAPPVCCIVLSGLGWFTARDCIGTIAPQEQHVLAVPRVGADRGGIFRQGETLQRKTYERKHAMTAVVVVVLLYYYGGT